LNQTRTDVSVDLKVGATGHSPGAASAEQLNTTTPNRGTISNKLVQNLPYNGRDGLNFAR